MVINGLRWYRTKGTKENEGTLLLFILLAKLGPETLTLAHRALYR